MKNVMGRKIGFWVVTVLLVYASTAMAGSVPQMINYSGSLTNTGGTPVPNGNYNIEFKIYDVASGGTPLWSEKWDSTTSQIAVVGGVFNVMLGFKSPIPASFFGDYPTTYLGIKVGTDSEMLPRQQITSVGYALTAGNGVPRGGVIMWSGTIDANGNPVINGTPDTSWHICDGLKGTPDLRNRFVVGAGGGYAVAATGGEASHILTVNEMPNHTHTDAGHVHWDNAPASTGGSAGSGSNQTGIWKQGPNTGVWATAAASANIQAVGGGAAHNNLPPYYALAYIMKL